MVKTIVVIVLALAMIVGCASRLEIRIEGDKMVMVAEDYTVKVTPQKGIAAAPNRWFTSSGLVELIKTFFDSMVPVLTKPQPVVVPQPQPPVVVPPPTPPTPPAPQPQPQPQPWPYPVPTPVPTPVPVPTPDTIFSKTGTVLSLDLSNVPSLMRAAGFYARDNALWYSLAHVYAFGPGLNWDTKGDAELTRLLGARQQIYDWFDKEVAKVASLLRVFPDLRVVAVINDAVDRLGVRLAPAIVNALKDFGSRVTEGQTVPWSAYP